ncbi:MAG: hypothetical protein OXI03_04930 [Chloroflexota bacterium]|nr:hypothetical protein [Chloroflexota bacterium]
MTTEQGRVTRAVQVSPAGAGDPALAERLRNAPDLAQALEAGLDEQRRGIPGATLAELTAIHARKPGVDTHAG